MNQDPLRNPCDPTVHGPKGAPGLQHPVRHLRTTCRDPRHHRLEPRSRPPHRSSPPGRTGAGHEVLDQPRCTGRRHRPTNQDTASTTPGYTHHPDSPGGRSRWSRFRTPEALLNAGCQVRLGEASKRRSRIRGSWAGAGQVVSLGRLVSRVVRATRQAAWMRSGLARPLARVAMPTRAMVK